MKGIITRVNRQWCVIMKIYNIFKAYPINNESIYYGGFGIQEGKMVDFELEAKLVKIPDIPGTDNKSIDKLKETSKKKRRIIKKKIIF